MPSLPDSLQYIIYQLSNGSALTPADVMRVLKEANVKEDELKPWMDFDHSPEDSYGRKMVYKAPNFEVMVMSWLPGDYSAIHDHGFTTWGAVKAFGPNEHAVFMIQNDQIVTLSRMRFEQDQIIGVGHDLVHQMGNPTEANVVTLHVYGIEEPKEKVTGDTRLFDVVNGQIQIINDGVFYDLSASEIEELQQGPKGDFPTKLRHMVELGSRIDRKGIDLQQVERIRQQILSTEFLNEFGTYLASILDSTQSRETTQLHVIQEELKATARFFGKEVQNQYAKVYDDLMGQSSFENLMRA